MQLPPLRFTKQLCYWKEQDLRLIFLFRPVIGFSLLAFAIILLGHPAGPITFSFHLILNRQVAQAIDQSFSVATSSAYFL